MKTISYVTRYVDVAIERSGKYILFQQQNQAKSAI